MISVPVVLFFVISSSASCAVVRTRKDRSANTPLYSSFRLWIELLIFALFNCDPDMAYTLPGVRSSACPFPIRPAGGWRLGVRAELEQACQQRGVRLFVLLPRSPRLDGWVERAQRTHSEEFYQV